MLILKQWLKDSGKTQVWLAAQLGVSQPTVSAWISGEISPSVDKLCRLSKITGLTIDALLGNTSAKTA